MAHFVSGLFSSLRDRCVYIDDLYLHNRSYTPSASMVTVKVLGPLANLLDGELLRSGNVAVEHAVLLAQVVAVPRALDDDAGRVLGALVRATGTELARHGSRAPRVKLTVDVDETVLASKLPPTSLGVELLCRLAAAGAEREGTLTGEEQWALALVVVGSDEAGEDRSPVLGCASLVVEEGIVASHPHPSAVEGVGLGVVGVHGRSGVVCVEALDIVLVRPLRITITSAGTRQVGLLVPRSIVGECGLEADAPDCGVGARDGRGVLAETLNGVAHLVKDRVAGVHLDALPSPDGSRDGSGNVINVLETLQVEHGLEVGLLLLTAVLQNAVGIVDDGREVPAAVLRHALLSGHKVLPVVVDGLERTTAGVSRPHGARGEALNPGTQSTRVRTTSPDPGGLGRVGGALGVKRQLELASDAGKVLDRLLEGQVLEVLGRLNGVGSAVSPVAVLDHDYSAADLLGQHTSQPVIGQVVGVASGRDLTRGEDHDGGARALPVGRVVPGGQRTVSVKDFEGQELCCERTSRSGGRCRGWGSCDQ